MKKIWNFIDNCWGGFLGLFENKAFAFSFALVLTELGFAFAEPNADIPEVNVLVFAWLFGALMTAMCLVGTGIVKRIGYKWASALWGCLGALGGVLLVKLLLDKFV